MAPRTAFVAGNWKLNLGPSEAAGLARAIRSAVVGIDDVDLAVFPTTLSVTRVVDAFEGSRVAVGVQDIHSVNIGAFTGATSAVMARQAGCTRTLIGHSERRSIFGETDDDVAAKVLVALQAGLLPIVCVGETLAERDAGRVDEVVHRQLTAAYAALTPDHAATITLAYEPVWAIGTGRTATPDQAQAVHASIRRWLEGRYPAFVAEETRILYGGSVKATNASDLMACPDIDGALVGGASLDADSFAAIAAAGAR